MVIQAYEGLLTYLLLRILHPAHAHLAPPLHAYWISVWRRGCVCLAGRVLRMLNKFISGKQTKKNKQNKRKREERKKGKGNTCVFFLTSSLASADLTEKKPKINKNNLTLLKLSLG